MRTLLALTLLAQITGQTPIPNQVATGPTPRMPNGKPDLSGVWQRPYTPDMTKDNRNQKGAGELPFTPAGLTPRIPILSGSGIRWAVGTATLSSSTRSVSTAGRGSTPSAIRTAISCA